MGIYTNYSGFTSAHDWASEIPANEAYDAAFGCAHILADCQANDMALFEHTIYSDFAEIKAVQEGVGYVNENAFTDVIKKIVEMFKKLLAKIKGIFSAFLAKLTGAFKNGKDLVKKYEKQIIKYANWKDFKCKGVRKPKNNNIMGSINTMFQKINGVAVNYSISTIGGEKSEILKDTGLTSYNTTDKIKDAESEDIKNAIVEKYVSGVKDIKELHTEVMDSLFNEEETIEGDDQVKSASYFSAAWIKTILVDGEKIEKEIKKYNENLEKNINIIIDNLNKDDDKLATFIQKHSNSKIKNDFTANYAAADSASNKVKKLSGSDFDSKEVGENDADYATSTNTTDIQKGIHCLQKLAGNEQEVITKVTSEYMTVFKFALAQARKVWTAAAAWSSGVHKESVEYVNAVAECAAEQFYTNMEAIH